jgi:hypothetical protein
MRTLQSALFVGILFGLSRLSFAGLISYEGAVVSGTAPDGSSYSYGHEATWAPRTPTGGWTQYAGGDVIFAVDSSMFTFDYVDFDENGLSEGDQLYIHTTVDLLDYTGSMSCHYTLTDTIGQMEFDGVLTVGGSSSSEYAYGLSGYLNYHGELTADASHGQGYDAGSELVGLTFYQAAAHSTEFNGIRVTGKYDEGLDFAIWGDNHGPTGTWGALITDDGVYNDSFGLNLVVKAQPVPEPGTILLSLVGLGGLVAARRRRKK